MACSGYTGQPERSEQVAPGSVCDRGGAGCHLKPKEANTRRPTIPLSTLEDQAALRRFLETDDWVIEEVEQT